MSVLRVSVTQNDIDTGKRGAMCECPVAKAISRAMNSRDVAVDGVRLYALGAVIYLPPAAKEFITAFDYPGSSKRAGLREAVPFEFDLIV